MMPDILGQSSDRPDRVLAGAGASDPERDDLLERVRAQLAPGPEGYADLERVAQRLFMSARTLKRKLHGRGTTFRALLDDARFRQARHLLADPALDIQHVAVALGYRDPACFTRAFRRWSGRTPSQVRKAAKRPRTASCAQRAEGERRPSGEAKPSEAWAPAKDRSVC
jgi:AraC-like DNA-binding protein